MEEPESTMDDNKALGSTDSVREVDPCQVCQEIGHSSTADSYCPDCNEKLCAVCTKRHAASNATRDHKLITIEESKSNHHQYKCDLCLALAKKSSHASAFCDECDEFLCKECTKVHAVQKSTKQHTPIEIKTYLTRDRKLCDLCSENEAETWCRECTQTFCKTCSMMHRKQRSTKQHVLIPASEMPAPEIRECSPCSLRQLKTAAEKFCSECDEFLCTSCVSSHQTRKATQKHKLIDTSDYLNETKVLCDVCKLDSNDMEAKFACCECDERLCNECKDLHKKQKATSNHDIVDISSLQEKLSRRCNICDAQDNDAVTFCQQCEEHLCEKCTHAHKTRKATKNHVLQTPEQSEATELCEPCLEGNESIIAESFCITCDERMCADCFKSHRKQKKTKDHDMCSVQDKLSRSKIISCDICLSDNEQVIAVKFCSICDENLCEACVKQHTRQKLTKNHTISNSPHESTKSQTDKQEETGIKGSDALENQEAQGNGQAQALPDEKTDIDQKKPGKPVASKIKADSLELYWTKPEAFTATDSYQVRYKDPDNDTKWTSLHHEYTKSTINVTDLKANTSFVFQVRMVQNDEEGPYSEPSDVIATRPSPGGRLQGFSQIVEQGNPSKYALPLTELKYARCAEARSRKFELGSPPQTVCNEKTIMLVGATGTGKSTLVDGLVNYILGVNWNDPFRYTIIKLENEEQQRSGDQAQSQTEWITCYVINPEQGSRLDYRLTIIDTPGFGDTRGGLQRDKEIVDQIREMFSAKSDKGVTVIDAVCFLIKAPDARLTATQKYIFHAIMSLFGQDIEQNICSMVTFADGQEPPVIASLKAADLPFGKFFTFNNSGLFSKNTQLDSSSLSPMFWEMGVKSYRAFFDNLLTMQTKSLSLTKQVLDERQKLELTISSLQPQVDAGLSKVHGLKQELRIIEQHQNDIKDNKNFEYEVNETHQIQKELPIGQHVTNCLHCNMTCHDNCIYANDEDKKNCVAMNRTTGKCTVCTDHCHWKQHKNTPYIFEFIEKKVKKTYQEKMKKYNDASGELLNAEQVLEKMYEEFEELEEGIEMLMEEVNESNNRLKEIALRPNPLSMVEYIELMIESEKLEKKDGFQGRITALMEYRKKAGLTSDVERFTKEAAGTRSQRPKKDGSKGKKKFSFAAFFKKWNPFQVMQYQ